MLPRIVWLADSPSSHLDESRSGSVALRRHDKAVVEQALVRSGCSPLPLNLIQPIRISSHSATKSVSGLISSSVVAEEPFPRLAVELDWPPHQRRRWRNFVQVGLLRRTRVRHRDRRGFCGSDDLVVSRSISSCGCFAAGCCATAFLPAASRASRSRSASSFCSFRTCADVGMCFRTGLVMTLCLFGLSRALLCGCARKAAIFSLLALRIG